MSIPFVAFWVVLIWSVIDGDLDAREGAIFVSIWAALLLGFLLLHIPNFWFVVPMVLLDIVLIFKVFGGDIQIR